MALLPLPLSSITDPAIREVIAGLLAQQGPGATSAAGQLPGTATNDNASAGNVGQYVSSNIPLASAITLVLSATAYNITSISLTAGDWDVCGMAFLGGATSTTNWTAGITVTSATRPTLADTISGTNGPLAEINIASGLSNGHGLAVGSGRVSLSGTTTVYLIAYELYTGTAPIAYGYISARRIR